MLTGTLLQGKISINDVSGYSIHSSIKFGIRNNPERSIIGVFYSTYRCTLYVMHLIGR